MGRRERSSAPEVSILLASRNEGDSLRRTLDSIVEQSRGNAFEVVVVDDASDDGSARPSALATEGKPVEVVRNPERKGLIVSRALAADRARGRYLMFLDAHCAVTEGWLEALRRELRAIDERGIVVPQIYPLKPSSWEIDLASIPGRGCSIINPFLDFGWREPWTVDGQTATCTIGGAAWMCTRGWYDHIGGLDRGMVSWGGENIDVSLRTWLAGGYCTIADGVAIGHLFKNELLKAERPNPVLPADLTLNKIRLAHTVFSKPILSRVLRNLEHSRGYRAAMRLVEDDAESVTRLRAHAESIRKRSDAWIIDKFQLPLLEPRFFYLTPVRKARDDLERYRPSVGVIVLGYESATSAADTAASIVSSTTYRNIEVILAETDHDRARRDAAREPDGRDHVFAITRVRTVVTTSGCGEGVLANLAALATDAEVLVFLRAGVTVDDPHWMEKLLLLFDRHRRLLMASPRIADASSPDRTPDRIHVEWDWRAFGFARERRGDPLASVPYQTLSCPPDCLFVHRGRFLELGGFDRSVRRGPLPVMDLAIHAWLSGFEVIFHPGVTVRRHEEPRTHCDPGEDYESRRWREYVAVLPSIKYFTNSARRASCRRKCPRAEWHVQRNGSYLYRRRQEFLSRSRFDDDWLFYKFAVPEAPHDAATHDTTGAHGD